MQNLLDVEYRKAILKEILGDENKMRKAESYRRAEIYNKRHQPFVERKLKEEFPEAHKDMRKVLSINIAKRISDKAASLYQTPPERSYFDDAGTLDESSTAILGAHYAQANVDTKLLRAQRTKKYQNQCVLQVVPARGIIDLRVYHPHQIDCVPMQDDPETPFAFVINAYDRSHSVTGGDGHDQKISDRNDGERQALKAMRFVWWSREHNFITDGLGDLVTDPGDVENPIGELPFIDVSDEKENEFWVRKGSSVIDFAIDFAVVISDTANINRLQGYAQGVIRSVEKPLDVRVGPNQLIWLPLDPNNPQLQPDLTFATPNPDMNASLDLLDRLVNYFMTAEGVDPKTINSKGESKSFSSGLERLLSHVEQFEQSRDELEYFRWIEGEVFRLMVLWHNSFVGAANSPLKPELQGPSIPDNAYLTVNFAKPEMIQTKAQAEESELKLLEVGLRSEVQALMTIDGLDEVEAVERLMKAKEHKALLSPAAPAVEPSEPAFGAV
jgi:hypothetical protein